MQQREFKGVLMSAEKQTGSPKRYAAVLGVVAVMCLLQAIYMVMRLANLSDFPPEQLGKVHLSTNFQILASAIGLLCLFAGVWNGQRGMTYIFYALTVINFGLSLYADQPLFAVGSVVALVLTIWWQRHN